MLRLFKYFFLLAAVFTAVLLVFYWKAINTGAGNGETVEFTIEKGEGLNKVAKSLYEKKLISSDLYFRIYIWKSDKQSRLQAGSYELDPSMTIKEIAEKLTSGMVKDNEISIKIIEGWDIGDIDRHLAEKGLIEEGSFAELAETSIGNCESGCLFGEGGLLGEERPYFLSDAPSEAGLEGFLFPDTYSIFIDSGPEDIALKMLDNFGNKFTEEMGTDIKNSGKSIYDIVTMASIIEKEVSSDQDRKIVSGILYERMRIGMRLEVDATINYITGKNNPGSLRADLQIDSPYNTYKYYGLPPGPISNPGLSAIEAAVYPEQSPYLFYLNRQDTKETIFSKTYEEHLANKRKYL